MYSERCGSALDRVANSSIYRRSRLGFGAYLTGNEDSAIMYLKHEKYQKYLLDLSSHQRQKRR